MPRHRKNLKRKTIKVKALKTPTREELAELINLWHLSRVHSSNRHERMLYTSKYFAESHPDYSSTGAYKILERQLAGLYINPPKVKIYERVKEIVAVKGPGHKCDAACKRAGHTYIHKFSSKNKSSIYGDSSGDLLITNKKTP